MQGWQGQMPGCLPGGQVQVQHDFLSQLFVVSHFEDSVDFSRIVLEGSCHNRFSVCFFLYVFLCVFLWIAL